jgi:C_GCAxxG_C_C family probable redox protein
MTHSEAAVSCFNEGFSCAQAVLSTLAPALGMDRITALRVAGAFGGGMARTGQTCGAVTGALMALGLRYGAVTANDREAKERTSALARQFMESFKARHGALLCPELLGYDLGDPEGRRAAQASGLFTSLCPRLVASATELLEAMAFSPIA